MAKNILITENLKKIKKKTRTLSASEEDSIVINAAEKSIQENTQED